MKNRKIIIILTYIFISMLFSAGGIYSETKKKLFINNITPKDGVLNEFAVKMRDEITLAIFENYSGRYQIVTDDDISVMYEKTSLMMATGSDSQSAAVQVANAVNADEIIYGTVSKEGNLYRFTMQNLLRNSSDNSVSKKSFVTLDFSETQSDWYCREVAKKLIDPCYKIDERKAVTMIVPKFDIDEVDVKNISGTSIQKISFEYKDEIAGRIIRDLKPTVEEGDKYFKDGEYENALAKYREVIRTIGTKLRRDTQEKIEPFIREIIDRIGAVHTGAVKKDIEKIDNYLQSQKPVTVEMLERGREKYNAILATLSRLPNHERKGMPRALRAIENRLTSIYTTWISLYEQEGDTVYSNYQFKKAVTFYSDGLRLIDESHVSNEKISGAKDRIQKKKDIVITAGSSYLENKVMSYCNAAEYLNMKDRQGKALEYLEKAKQMIMNNKDFANEKMVNTYKDTARIIKR